VAASAIFTRVLYEPSFSDVRAHDRLHWKAILCNHRKEAALVKRNAMLNTTVDFAIKPILCNHR